MEDAERMAQKIGTGRCGTELAIQKETSSRSNWFWQARPADLALARGGSAEHSVLCLQ